AESRSEIDPAWTSAMIVAARNEADINTPLAAAPSARPYERNSYSAFASGGPTARAPPDGQTRQRAPSKIQPQEGQMAKMQLPRRIENARIKLELRPPVRQG